MAINDLAAVRTLLEYTDWSNDQLLSGAVPLADEQLDREMQIGVGTMRRTLLHIYNGEYVWLRRWRGGVEAETKWPSESERVSVAELETLFARNRRDRETYLDELAAEIPDLLRVQPYRDSKGNTFMASLGDMLVQGVMHSKHHQAQAANILRRLDAKWPELDYMMRIRKPA